MLENYLYLSFDSLTAAIILPIRSESAIHAMIIFGNYNSLIIFTIALISSTLGSVINWQIGKSLISLRSTKLLKNYQKEIALAEINWDKYVVWMLLFSALKILGNPLSLLAGFLKTSFKKLLLLIILGKAVYYFYLLFLLK